MNTSSDQLLIGVWDQVLSFGQYQHQTVNGTPCLTMHDASTCKVMLDDFAAHPDCDIFYDKQHEVEEALGDDALDRDKMLAWAGDGNALAWANALVMIMGGEVARYEPHPAAPPTAPRADDVLLQSDGTRRGDGVYCLRSEVTPRGADPIDGLANFRQTSPYYVPERDGNRLLNLTATNDPRMRGCALAFNRSGQRVAMSRVTSGNLAVSMQRGDKDSGVAVMLVPDQALAARLAVDGGEKADDLHCTVVYIGKSSGLTPAREMALRGAVEIMAATFGPLKGRIAGIGRFSNEPREACVALVDAPDLPWLRESILKKLSDAGIWQIPNDHGFNPHITLKYVDAAESTPSRIDAIDLKFTGITVAIGGAWTTYEFLGAQAMGRSKKDTMDEQEMARLMEAAGCKAEDKPEEKIAKMARHAAAMESEAKKEKEASEMARKTMEDSKEEMARAKMSASARSGMEAKEVEMGRKMSGEERSKFEAEHKEPDGEEPKAMQAMSRRLRAAEEKNGMLAAELKEVRAIVPTVQAMERQAKEKVSAIWAQEAVSMRRVKPTRCGTEAQTVAWLAAKHMKDPVEAADVLSDEGTFGIVEAQVMGRGYIENGAPKGSPDPREGGALSVDAEMSAAIAEETKKIKAEGGKGDFFRMSMQRIAKTKPALHQRYVAAQGSN